MRRLLLPLLLSLTFAAMAAGAPPFLRELAPREILSGSGERYLQLYGSNFPAGSEAVLSGPAGTFTVVPSGVYGFEPTVRMQVWVPVEVVNQEGHYSVFVRNAGGDSAALPFEVIDGSVPVLHLPPYVHVEATGPEGAIATYEATADSSSSNEVTISCAPVSGATFPLGRTTVRCTAVADDGSTASGQFEVSVYDRTPPVLTLPEDILVDAANDDGAVVTFATSATDTVDTDVPVTCFPASGSQFAIRTTEVRCSATDDSFNSTIRSFTVTVTDNAWPMLMLPADITVPSTSSSGAIVTFNVSAMDYAERMIPATCTPESSSLFPIATNEVTCRATDDMDRTSTGTFRVIVTGTPPDTPPSLSLPGDIAVVTEDGADGAVVTFAAIATDYANRNIPVHCAPVSGSLFPIGLTTVTCSAMDDRELTSTGTFTVTVTEPVTGTPPVLTLPEDFTVEATSADGAVVTFTATAHDEIDGEVVAVCTPPSGSTFALGTTTVECSAGNQRGFVARGTFIVNVVAAAPPQLSLPGNMTVEATSANGATVTFTATATDVVDGDVPVTCTPASGSTFPAGTTVVECSATSSRGLTATGHFNVTVTVTDTDPPVIISITATPNRLWPVNKRLVDVVVTVNAVDDVDATLTARITGVLVSENVPDTDWFLRNDLTAVLRADRNGKEQPRIYTLVVEVSDSSGNIATGTVNVTVPHDSSENGTTPSAPARRRSARH